MIPPTSIDGTDITGATIDGTDVQEITVDGDVVFSAQQLPVAYSNLIAWYPFDSATYGGSNADDVTALFNPSQSGDSIAYDGAVSGPTYQSSGGATDINAGSSSGYYDFPGTNDRIEVQDEPALSGLNPFTVTFWAKIGIIRTTVTNNLSDIRPIIIKSETPFDSTSDVEWEFVNDSGFFDNRITFQVSDGNSISALHINHTQLNTNDFFHFAGTFDNGSHEFFLDGTSIDSDTGTITSVNSTNFPIFIGKSTNFASQRGHFAGELDDIRIYNTALSQLQIQQIYNNTKPAGKP